ncbi:hypothetical protein [Aquimarina aggregata]|uniref:hypothetical protein n=1 Tax=Aquimarina aggregata TaxID=1642818 RepID=UPI002493343D|nr:hypothetical protein [Aquimarina aggregata]
MKPNFKLHSDEPNHLENVVLNVTNSKLLGIAFLISMIGFVFVRRNFGCRIIKPESTLFTFLILLVIEGFTSWYAEIPFIGQKIDLSSFLILGVAYVALSIYHLIRAEMDARTIPYRYTRSPGDGYVFDWISKLNLPYFKQNPQRINAFIEPLFVFVVAMMIGKYIPNLGMFIKLIAICMCVTGVFIIKNHDDLKHDQNDALILGNLTQENMKDTKSGSRKTSASPSKRATVSQPTRKSDSK